MAERTPQREERPTSIRCRPNFALERNHSVVKRDNACC